MKSLNVLLVTAAIVSVVAVSCSLEEKANPGSNLVLMQPVLPETPYSYSDNNTPADVVGNDAIDDDKATLGRVLFYDKTLSINNSIACASCHLQIKGFSDGKATSGGVSIAQTSRNSMAIANLGAQNSFFWDERENNLVSMAVKPIQNHVEMGFDKLDNVVNNLNATPYYKPLIAKAFNNAESINQKQLAEALQQFLISVQSYNSKYDIGRKINFTNYTKEEMLGKELFTEKLHCKSCHNEPTFASQWGTGTNIGLDLEYKDNGIGAWLKSQSNPRQNGGNPDFLNGAFKIPSLRNIEFTAPYMHDGRFKTLEEVVEHYNSGVKEHPNLDWRITNTFDFETNQPRNTLKLGLTQAEKNALVAFMKTLSDHEMMSDPKFSNPFKPVN